MNRGIGTLDIKVITLDPNLKEEAFGSSQGIPNLQELQEVKEDYELTASFRMSTFLSYSKDGKDGKDGKDNKDPSNLEEDVGWVSLGFEDGKPHNIWASWWVRGIDVTYYDKGNLLASYTDINSPGLTKSLQERKGQGVLINKDKKEEELKDNNIKNINNINKHKNKKRKQEEQETCY